jgi:hypothetical protein
VPKGIVFFVLSLIIAAPSVLAQNFLTNPGFEDFAGTFNTSGSGVTTASSTWDQWYGFQRWQSVMGNTALRGVDNDGNCSAEGAQVGDSFPFGWAGNNFAQDNPDFTNACDQRDKLIQAVDGAGLNGEELELKFKYINDNPQTNGLLYWVCGLNSTQSVPLFFAGSGCGKSSNGGTTITSGTLAESATWQTFSTTFNINADFAAIAVVIELGGRVYPAPGIAAGVDDVYLGFPNNPPDCSGAAGNIDNIWPPNHLLVPVNVLGVTDIDGDTLTITIDAIFQDEPVNGTGDGDTAPDGAGIGTSQAEVRAERAGSENGRVYTIAFTADDGQGGTCSSTVAVGVPKSQKGIAAVDDGPLYDSTAS